jgi:hypothetical protein
MIYYIINGIGIITLCYFQYKRYKLIKDIKNIEGKKTYRFEHGSWANKSRDGDWTWKVFLILKEDVKSTDKKMTKFIVEKVISENQKDTDSDFANYTNDFYGSTGGGWVKNNSKKLLEYVPTSIWEKRIKKLEQLGIK